jgi:hypothetical protein
LIAVTTTDWWVVTLEVKRVQEFLFAIPRLKAMVGANVLLGETLRGLFNGQGFQPGSVPALAVDHGASWPASHAEAVVIDPVGASSLDPNCDVLQWTDGNGKSIPQDDPFKIAQRTGVLIRDASRVQAIFPSREQAAGFTRAAELLLSDRLPRTRIEIRLEKLGSGDATSAAEIDSARVTEGITLFDVPHAVLCEVSGLEPASTCIRHGERREYLATNVAERFDASARAGRGESHDIIGLLTDAIGSALCANGTRDREFPQEFSQVAPSQYMAVIHADGNDVGGRLRRQLESVPSGENQLARWARSELMFWQLRRGMRQSVGESLKETFSSTTNQVERFFPFRLLMIGGDDLLLVCDAPQAMPFVIALARSLTLQTAEAPGGSLSLGIGVAIVKSSFPFFRAHQLAEQLAGSAKRDRGQAADGNMVDWLIASESWVGDLAHLRAEQYSLARGDERILLSQRPLPVLGEGLSLENLWLAAKGIQSSGVARSQLKYLYQCLHLGRHQAELALRSMPRTLRAALSSWTPDEAPFAATEDGHIYATSLVDLLELVELCHLDLSPSSSGPSSTLKSLQAVEGAV